MKPATRRGTSIVILLVLGAVLCFTVSVMFAPGLPAPVRFGSYDTTGTPRPFIGAAIVLVSALVVMAFAFRLKTTWVRAAATYLVVVAVGLPLLVRGHLSDDGLWGLNVGLMLFLGTICGIVVGQVGAKRPPVNHR